MLGKVQSITGSCPTIERRSKQQQKLVNMASSEYSRCVVAVCHECEGVAQSSELILAAGVTGDALIGCEIREGGATASSLAEMMHPS